MINNQEHQAEENTTQTDANEATQPSVQTNEDTESQNEETLVEHDTVSKLEEQLKESQDKYIRLVAEFDNFRKRTMKERVELIKNASEDMVKSLLEVLDDADRAIQQIETSDNIAHIKDGVTLVFNKLKSTLQQKGLTEMQTKGMEFDPESHEAVAEIPVPDAESAGKIIDEVIKGYLLNDKIIRHAKVVVGK